MANHALTVLEDALRARTLERTLTLAIPPGKGDGRVAPTGAAEGRADSGSRGRGRHSHRTGRATSTTTRTHATPARRRAVVAGPDTTRRRPGHPRPYRLRSGVAHTLSRGGGASRQDINLWGRGMPVRHPLVTGRVGSLGFSLEADWGRESATWRTVIDGAGRQQEERHARRRVFPGHWYRLIHGIRATRSPSGTPTASLGIRLAGLTARVGGWL